MAELTTRAPRLPDANVAFWQRLDSKWILIGVPIALVVWLSLVPLVFLLWQSFLTPQTASRPAVFTLDNFEHRLFQRRDLPAVLQLGAVRDRHGGLLRSASAPRSPG